MSLNIGLLSTRRDNQNHSYDDRLIRRTSKSNSWSVFSQLGVNLFALETETFKYLVSDGSFFNRMLTRVAKTELKSKKQSTKAETYLKFMMKRLQLWRKFKQNSELSTLIMFDFYFFNFIVKQDSKQQTAQKTSFHITPIFGVLNHAQILDQ